MSRKAIDPDIVKRYSREDVNAILLHLNHAKMKYQKQREFYTGEYWTRHKHISEPARKHAEVALGVIRELAQWAKQMERTYAD